LTYCTAADVRLIINTSLSDEEIDTVIETSDAYIDKVLGAQSGSDKLVKRLSMLLTAKAIKTRQPQSYAVGDYSEAAGNVLEVWDREIEAITAVYRRSLKAA
jgi:hypothetical protein